MFRNQPARTTTARGVRYSRELAVQEMRYCAPDDARVPSDPGEVQRTRPTWQRSLRSAPWLPANTPAITEREDEGRPAMGESAHRPRQYQVGLCSSLPAAIEQLSQGFQQSKENKPRSPPVWTNTSTISSAGPIWSTCGVITPPARSGACTRTGQPVRLRSLVAHLGSWPPIREGPVPGQRLRNGQTSRNTRHD